MRLIIALVIVMMASPAYAKLTSHHFELDNGMQVVVIPNHKVGAVTHMVWYRVGALDEPLGKSGIAHLLEHFMFKGTPQFPKGVFSKNVARAGGNDNAFTSHDYTGYYQTVPKDKLPMVMAMESDRMTNLLFDKPIDSERQVVIEERLSRTENQPEMLLNEQMMAALFRHHPYQRPIIGWLHEIEQLSLADAREFYRRHYAPNNAILVIAGDVELQEIKRLAQHYYGGIATGPKRHRPYAELVEPAGSQPIILNVHDARVAHPKWRRYYRTMSQLTEHKRYAYAQTLLAEYLSEDTTSRLYQKLVIDEKIAIGVGGYYDDLQLGPSVYSISVTPKSVDQFDAIERSIEEEITQIQNQGLDDATLAHLKKKLISQVIYAQEDIKTLAFIYGQAWVSGLGSAYVESWEQQINAVTNEDIKQAALVTFREENSVTGRLMP